jgi:hypothetical protein
MAPETIARAGEGDLAALKVYDERRLSRVGGDSPDQRPSMCQDMTKGGRTEIEFLNGFVVREGEQVGIQALANGRLVDILKKVDRATDIPRAGGDRTLEGTFVSAPNRTSAGRGDNYSSRRSRLHQPPDSGRLGGR